MFYRQKFCCRGYCNTLSNHIILSSYCFVYFIHLVLKYLYLYKKKNNVLQYSILLCRWVSVEPEGTRYLAKVRRRSVSDQRGGW